VEGFTTQYSPRALSVGLPPASYAAHMHARPAPVGDELARARAGLMRKTESRYVRRMSEMTGGCVGEKGQWAHSC